MNDAIARLAQRISSSEWNRPGADKTWVVETMWEHIRFLGEVAKARRERSG
jgi:hypothetical protein